VEAIAAYLSHPHYTAHNRDKPAAAEQRAERIEKLRRKMFASEQLAHSAYSHGGRLVRPLDTMFPDPGQGPVQRAPAPAAQSAPTRLPKATAQDSFDGRKAAARQRREAWDKMWTEQQLLTREKVEDVYRSLSEAAHTQADDHTKLALNAKMACDACLAIGYQVGSKGPVWHVLPAEHFATRSTPAVCRGRGADSSGPARWSMPSSGSSVTTRSPP
jgi:hypothetical protein